jgi:hypothetical protein
LADNREALRVDPKRASVHAALAWLQATCPDPQYRDGKAALANANKAYEITGGADWSFIDTLAAAYAENGDFKAAQQWAANAIEMATKEKDKEELRSRLKL